MNQSDCDQSETPLPEKPNDSRKNGGILRFATVVLVIVCFILLSFGLYFRITYVRVVIEGNSMNETLSDGDITYVDTRHSAKRGDIVVVDVSSYREEWHFSGDYIVKRLIAVEGDSLYCKDNQVYICPAGESEFKPLQEDYLSATAFTADFNTVTVGEGQVFVMGDNRQDSYDSRRTGCFKEENILGFMPDWAYNLKSVFTILNDKFKSDKK